MSQSLRLFDPREFPASHHRAAAFEIDRNQARPRKLSHGFRQKDGGRIPAMHFNSPVKKANLAESDFLRQLGSSMSFPDLTNAVSHWAFLPTLARLV